jgi:hypothetical protein
LQPRKQRLREQRVAVGEAHLAALLVARAEVGLAGRSGSERRGQQQREHAHIMA